MLGAMAAAGVRGMAEFSIPEAAFTGFRVARRHPRALAIWAALQLVVSLTFGLLFMGAAGPALRALQATGLSPGADPAKTMSLIRSVLPAYAVAMPFVLALSAVQTAAMNRVVLAPDQDRFGYLRLGADEARQFGLLALILALFLGVYFGLVIVVAVIAAIAMAALKVLGDILVALLVMAAVGVLVYGAVRLSLAPALTFDTRRIDLPGAWRLTRGRVRPLLLTYLLALASAVVVYLLSMVIIYAAGALLGGMNTITRLDVGSIGAYLNPATLAQIILSAGVSALVLPLTATPPATIYRRLVPGIGVAAAFA
jgi:hypothetical protein